MQSQGQNPEEGKNLWHTKKLSEKSSEISRLARKNVAPIYDFSQEVSKDFWFEKNDYNEQCGVIMFKIKGS